MAVVTSQFLQAAFVAWKKRFQESQVIPDAIYQALCMTIPSTTRSDKHVWLGAMPAIQRWVGELEEANVRPFEYELENHKFGALLSVEREALEDDQIYGIGQLFAEMGQLFGELPDVLFQEALAAGESALCYDGLPFFSASHQEGDSGVQSNLINQPLTTAGLKVARLLGANYKDDKGKLRPVRFDTLVVGPAREDEAIVLLTSDKVVLAGNSDVSRGDANPDKNRYKLLVAPRITDNSWCLAKTNGPVKPFLFQDRTPTELVSVTNLTDHEVAVSDKFKYRGRRRCRVGYGKWRYCIKSQGG